MEIPSILCALCQWRTWDLIYNPLNCLSCWVGIKLVRCWVGVKLEIVREGKHCMQPSNAPEGFCNIILCTGLLSEKQ